MGVIWEVIRVEDDEGGGVGAVCGWYMEVCG